jgi:hypothetical protein
LTDPHLLNDPLFNKYDVLPINKDDFHSKQIDKFIRLYNKPANNFWTVTATRLFYVCEFLLKNKIKNTYFFENDVLLYYNLQELHKNLIKDYKHMAITVGGEDKCMTGFCFIPNATDFLLILLAINSLLSENTHKELLELYNVDMIHEMSLLRIIMKKYHFLVELNSMPQCPYYNTIFDPAGWGQFVGGTTNGIPGAKPKDHYIGQMLIENPEYNVVWKEDQYGRNIPYFFDGKKEKIRINNLHIHSKNLYKYMSL